MQKQKAWLCQLYPFDRNDTAMHKHNLCKFDLDIYVRVKERYHKQTTTLLSFQLSNSMLMFRHMLEIW